MARIFLGIDIGADKTKVAVIEYAANKYYISDFFMFSTPFEGDAAAQQRVDSKKFIDALSKTVPLNKIHSGRVAVNIPPSLITAMSLFLPPMNKKELVSATINEAKRKMIPAYAPNHTFECLIIGQRTINKLSRVETLAVRTDNFYINRVVEIFREIDVIPGIIAPACFSLHLLPFYREFAQKDKDTAFVDIGLNSVNISVFRDGVVNFFRNTTYGLQDVIQDFSQRLGFAENKVNEFIKEYGIPEVDFDIKNKVEAAEEIMRQKYEEGAKDAEPKDRKPVNLLEFRMLWEVHIEKMLHEFRRSLSYYKEQSGGRQVENICFVGGGCLVKNLVKILSELIRGESVIVSPFKGLHVSKDIESSRDKESAPLFSNAIALGLNAAARVKKQPAVNFLPVELRKKEEAARRLLALFLFALSCISFLGLVSLQLFLNNILVNKNISTIEFELKRLKKVSARLKDIGQREKMLNMRLNKIEGLLRAKTALFVPVVDICRMAPKEMLFSDFSLNKEKIQIKAEVFSTYEEAVSLIEEFKGDCLELKYLGDIEITPLKLEKIIPDFDSDGSGGIILDKPQKRSFTFTSSIALQ